MTCVDHKNKDLFLPWETGQRQTRTRSLTALPLSTEFLPQWAPAHSCNNSFAFRRNIFRCTAFASVSISVVIVSVSVSLCMNLIVCVHVYKTERPTVTHTLKGPLGTTTYRALWSSPIHASSDPSIVTCERDLRVWHHVTTITLVWTWSREKRPSLTIWRVTLRYTLIWITSQDTSMKSTPMLHLKGGVLEDQYKPHTITKEFNFLFITDWVYLFILLVWVTLLLKNRYESKRSRDSFL